MQLLSIASYRRLRSTKVDFSLTAALGRFILRILVQSEKKDVICILAGYNTAAKKAPRTDGNIGRNNLQL